MKTENLFMPDCIRTFTGQYVNVFDPDPDTIVIEDIAHALSMQCRFGGHLPHFYSVAEHSIAVSYLCSWLPLESLMHDSSEAYLLDIPTPIKNTIPKYHVAENRMMAVIAQKFGFSWPLRDEVKKADRIQLRIEWETFMIAGGGDGYTQAKAETEFLKRFKEVTK